MADLSQLSDEQLEVYRDLLQKKQAPAAPAPPKPPDQSSPAYQQKHGGAFTLKHGGMSFPPGSPESQMNDITLPLSVMAAAEPVAEGAASALNRGVRSPVALKPPSFVPEAPSMVRSAVESILPRPLKAALNLVSPKATGGQPGITNFAQRLQLRSPLNPEPLPTPRWAGIEPTPREVPEFSSLPGSLPSGRVPGPAPARPAPEPLVRPAWQAAVGGPPETVNPKQFVGPSPTTEPLGTPLSLRSLGPAPPRPSPEPLRPPIWEGISATPRETPEFSPIKPAEGQIPGTLRSAEPLPNPTAPTLTESGPNNLTAAGNKQPSLLKKHTEQRQALIESRKTIKPPPGFSMGAMKNYTAEPSLFHSTSGPRAINILNEGQIRTADYGQGPFVSTSTKYGGANHANYHPITFSIDPANAPAAEPFDIWKGIPKTGGGSMGGPTDPLFEHEMRTSEPISSKAIRKIIVNPVAQKALSERGIATLRRAAAKRGIPVDIESPRF